jgi:ubiquinone/menaquinone biosynthesis C-methylase UbiE
MQPAGSPAEIYERHMVPAMLASWVPALLDLVALKPGERVLDIACGTGVVARQAVPQVGAGGRVAGLDLNRDMLALARSREPAVEWREGDAMALPFATNAFDVVVCQQGLQFFPDSGRALREAHRVLVPGGRFAVAVWCALESNPGQLALTRGLERHVGTQAAGLMSAVFRLGDAHTLQTMLEIAGFHQVRVHREKRVARFPSPELFVRWVVLGSVLGRTGVQVRDESLAAIIREVDAALQSYVHADGLAFPMEAHLAIARTLGNTPSHEP